MGLEYGGADAPARAAGSLDLAVIGNCAVAALIDRAGAIIFSCFPRPDGNPVFCALLDGAEPTAFGSGPGGRFAVELADQVSCEQNYVENTAVLQTRLKDARGGEVEILDFCPRFTRFERFFRPPQIFRRVTPIAGRPRIRFDLRPRFSYGARAPDITRGSHHVRFVGPNQALRLTTDAPVSYILDGRPFALDQPVSLVFGADEPLPSEVDATTREFLEKTVSYWRGWVRSLSIPFEWQRPVIRAAITLKLCSFEETGAIMAALTTSIPEAPGSGRNWDYRFCWLRDAYFVVHALNRLGATKTMEDYLAFITNVVDDLSAEGGEHLPPLHPIARGVGGLEERIADGLSGYRGDGPVRYGNGAADQIQNDGYGAVILAATQAFFDHRMIRPGNEALFRQLEQLGELAIARFDQPDAGPWELRTIAQVHTFSAAMCWAACDRLALIAQEAFGLEERAKRWRAEARRMHDTIQARAWSERLGHFVSAFEGDGLDASLLLLHELGFVAADDPRYRATVDAVGEKLRRDDLILRYDARDDFGKMESGFLVCSFWYIDALHAIGRREEARALFEKVLARRNSFGLLSEDADLTTGELWGNFPQTYSMVGLINTATRLSRSWERAF